MNLFFSSAVMFEIIRPSILRANAVTRSFNGFRKKSTIFALSSGHGRSAIAVIRISGPGSRTILERMVRLNAERVEPRKCLYRKIIDPENGETLDNGLVVWFPGPKSYTGEDSAEFHLHGGIAVIASVINTLRKFPGCRMAEPGEFTKRAFFAGKVDATEVEGLADLLRAETEVQRRQAVRQVSGELAKLYLHWRGHIVQHLAHLEAFVDFGEDQDIDGQVIQVLERSIEELLHQLRCHLDDNRRGERLRHGVRVAIVGEPNVGKSSLLNLLSRQQVAIVSPMAGTTRDVLTSNLDIGGYPIILCDTAGLRTTQDPVESQGLKRARDVAEAADLLVLVLDATRMPADVNGKKTQQLVQEECRRLAIPIGENAGYVVLINKMDLAPEETAKMWQGKDETDVCALSCKTELGLARFLGLLQAKVAALCANPAEEAPLITSSRQRFHLERCRAELDEFLNLVRQPNGDLALAGHRLRMAARQIGYITGRIDTEEVLDVLFNSFCIGK